jgi:hypothetical protein
LQLQPADESQHSPLQRLNTDPSYHQLPQDQEFRRPSLDGTFTQQQPQYGQHSPNPSSYQAYSPHNSNSSTTNLSLQNQRPTDLNTQLAYQQQQEQPQRSATTQQFSPPSQAQYQAYDIQAHPQGPRAQGRPPSAQGNMAPASTMQPRRSVDVNQQNIQGGSRDGPPPPFTQSASAPHQPPNSNINHFLQNPNVQGQSYRGGPPQQQQRSQPVGEQGRSTPPLSRDPDELVPSYDELSK